MRYALVAVLLCVGCKEPKPVKAWEPKQSYDDAEVSEYMQCAFDAWENQSEGFEECHQVKERARKLKRSNSDEP